MIINTGMRTDIPAFYSEWFYNRIAEGYVVVRSPYNGQLTRYDISPDKVDLIGFCTKNPAPMLQRLNELDAYKQFWFVTITPYGRNIEPNVPAKEKVIDDFRKLSRRVGLNCIGWRYDPILINTKYTVKYHIEVFRKMAEYLSGYTDVCVVSFIDLYDKVKRNFPEIHEVPEADRHSIAAAFAAIGRQYGITIKGCSEGKWMEQYGIDCSGCMTQAVYEKAIGDNIIVPGGKYYRPECGCLLSNDIGAYNSCGHLCRYCYANYDSRTVKDNMARHNPKSPLLIGEIHPGEKIIQAQQASWLDREISLF